jgi:hypothetical protein
MMDYMQRILKALSDGHITGGMVMPNVQHDDGCGMLKSDLCTCVPDISVETEDGYIEIDEHGNIKKKI